MKRRTLLKATTTLAASLVAGVAMAADPIIVGAVAPKTGPLAGGAAVTHWPNIQLWGSSFPRARGRERAFSPPPSMAARAAA